MELLDMLGIADKASELGAHLSVADAEGSHNPCVVSAYGFFAA